MDPALKQRLLGAVVLIALVVIFVPMFLAKSPPQHENTTVNLEIPKPPQRSFETRTLPLDMHAQPTQPDHPAAAAATTLPPATVEVPPQGSAAKSPATSTTATTRAPAPSKPQPAPPVPKQSAHEAGTNARTGGFAVHLGVYADSGHADALVAKLKKLGYSAYDEPTDYHGLSATRVRVGPFDDRAAAESARLHIKRVEPKVPSSIVEAAVSPTRDAPASALPAGRAGGWAVQVGAFSAQADADKLRNRLRKGGVASFVDRSGSGDRVLWRVRAGPYADRASADKARAAVKQKFKLKNPIVVTQP